MKEELPLRPTKIQFRCPQCNKSISVDRQHAGKRGKCPGCGHTVQVPANSELAAKQPHHEILWHMEQHHGAVQELALQEIVPALGVSIHVIPASHIRNYITLFTAGMSDRPMTTPPGCEEFRHAELLIHLPADWPMGESALRDVNTFWPFEWLRRIAAFPHENGTWLGGRYSIIATDEPPRPLAPNTKLSCLLLLQELDEAGKLQCDDGRSIIFYSVMPIYVEERDLERSQGMKELLERFEHFEVSPMVDINRVNVATAKSRSIWSVGQRVLAQWSPEKFFYPGVIRAEKAGKYLLEFDDGDQAWVTSRQIAVLDVGVGSRVFARWKGGPAYYPGKVTRQEREKILVRYDDGDEEWTTVSMVRVER